MLDVHVVESASTRNIATSPEFSFSEAAHSAIFHGAGIDVYSKFAHLRGMHDYYADAQYSGDSLLRLVEDIDKLLPMINSYSDACAALTELRRICVDAHAGYKTVFLVCD